MPAAARGAFVHRRARRAVPPAKRVGATANVAAGRAASRSTASNAARWRRAAVWRESSAPPQTTAALPCARAIPMGRAAVVRACPVCRATVSRALSRRARHAATTPSAARACARRAPTGSAARIWAVATRIASCARTTLPAALACASSASTASEDAKKRPRRSAGRSARCAAEPRIAVRRTSVGLATSLRRRCRPSGVWAIRPRPATTGSRVRSPRSAPGCSVSRKQSHCNVRAPAVWRERLAPRRAIAVSHRRTIASTSAEPWSAPSSSTERLTSGREWARCRRRPCPRRPSSGRRRSAPMNRGCRRRCPRWRSAR